MILADSRIFRKNLGPFGLFQGDLCLALLILLSSCSPKLEKTTPDEFKQVLHGQAQGTTWNIVYYDIRERNFQKSVDSILQRIDESISTYQEGSVIDTWNNSDSGSLVDALFIEVYINSWKSYKATFGAFDPTVMPLVSYWGFGPEKYVHPESINKLEIDSISELVSFESLELIVNGKALDMDSLSNQGKPLKAAFLRKRDPRIKLDFNAIGQGWSVDKVAEFIESKDVKVFFIEIGGEIVAGNPKPDGELWRFGIDKPESDLSKRALNAVISIRNRGMATSGNYRKFYEQNGIKYSHTINPHTGFPVKHNLLSATVVSTTASEADALATAFMVMGKDSTISYLSKRSYMSAYVYLIYDSAGVFKTYNSPQIKSNISKVD
jgi:FAD:protein FMN transferase